MTGFFREMNEHRVRDGGTWYVRYETRSHGNKSQSDDEKRIDIPLEVTGEPETWMGGEQNVNVDMKGKGEGGREKVEEKVGRGRWVCTLHMLEK